MTTPLSPLAPTALRLQQWLGLQPGPKLLILGAVHGNETCGTQAIQHIQQELEQGQWQLRRGQLSLLPITNPWAYQQQQRVGDRNLNRDLHPKATPQDYEDHLANVLCPILQAHDVLLDLHSFHTAGEPFALLGPENNSGPLEPFQHAAAEMRLATLLGPQRLVEGWMSTYERGVRRRQQQAPAQSAAWSVAYGMGTTEYMRAQGGYGITLECGQHQDPQAPAVAYRAIKQTLACLNMVDAPPEPVAGPFQLLRLVDVVDRESPNDQLAQAWRSFAPVQAGELIGRRADGQAWCAPCAGFIVFPNPQAAVGQEWFYFAVSSPRAC